MYICIYVYMYRCIYVCMYVYIYIYISAARGPLRSPRDPIDANESGGSGPIDAKSPEAAATSMP